MKKILVHTDSYPKYLFLVISKLHKNHLCNLVSRQTSNSADRGPPANKSQKLCEGNNYVVLLGLSGSLHLGVKCAVLECICSAFCVVMYWAYQFIIACTIFFLLLEEHGFCRTRNNSAVGGSR